MPIVLHVSVILRLRLMDGLAGTSFCHMRVGGAGLRGVAAAHYVLLVHHARQHSTGLGLMWSSSRQGSAKPWLRCFCKRGLPYGFRSPIQNLECNLYRLQRGVGSTQRLVTIPADSHAMSTPVHVLSCRSSLLPRPRQLHHKRQPHKLMASWKAWLRMEAETSCSSRIRLPHHSMLLVAS
jgi:hypothetical protein